MNKLITIEQKSPMLLSQRVRKCYYTTLGTTVINSPMFSPSLTKPSFIKCAIISKRCRKSGLSLRNKLETDFILFTREASLCSGWSLAIFWGKDRSLTSRRLQTLIFFNLVGKGSAVPPQSCEGEQLLDLLSKEKYPREGGDIGLFMTLAPCKVL